MRWDSPAATTDKAATIAASDLTATEVSTAKRQRVSPDAAAAPSEAGAGVPAVGDRTQRVEALDALGLKVVSVPTDGACGFHTLSCWFKRARKSTHEPGALRAQLVAHMEKKSSVLEPLWDRMDPKGRPCASLTAYLAALGKPDAWMGELDLLAAADKWALKIVVIRPNQPTV
eukprot:4578067-Pyramimonas_sp.AAC.1